MDQILEVGNFYNKTYQDLEEGEGGFEPVRENSSKVPQKWEESTQNLVKELKDNKSVEGNENKCDSGENLIISDMSEVIVKKMRWKMVQVVKVAMTKVQRRGTARGKRVIGI